MKHKCNVVIVGATGVVGLELLKILAQRRFPINELRLTASDRSIGRTLKSGHLKGNLQRLTEEVFDGVDIAFFCAGNSVSREWAHVAVKYGAVVIDKTGAFRMDKDVPLVVPEVNADALRYHKGIISSPNCSTIPLVMVLKPLHDYARVKRVIVSTYQSVSGAGLKAITEMEQQTLMRLKLQIPNLKFQISHSPRASRNRIFPYPIAFNVIPQIPQSNAFCADDYTDEEVKVINETGKIMNNKSIRVSATCVRVPVYHGHSESVNIEFARPITPAKARQILAKSPGLKVIDNPARQLYPTAAEEAGKDDVFVGRIRVDRTVKHGLNLWLVGDNIRKGAALNAIQIAEYLTTKAQRALRSQRK
ncbi:MAG: aspartate-semialdehyde dehydrogenase [Planctomycetes bacterium]|nr:aspartate-semialdehyde dehydrogenase [Planctomycetota bacterium]